MKNLLKSFNAKRRANKNKWIEFAHTLDGRVVQIKSYNTWIQIIQVNGMRGGSPMELSVKKMNEFIVDFCNRVNA